MAADRYLLLTASADHLERCVEEDARRGDANEFKFTAEDVKFLKDCGIDAYGMEERNVNTSI